MVPLGLMERGLKFEHNITPVNIISLPFPQSHYPVLTDFVVYYWSELWRVYHNSSTYTSASLLWIIFCADFFFKLLRLLSNEIIVDHLNQTLFKMWGAELFRIISSLFWTAMPSVLSFSRCWYFCTAVWSEAVPWIYATGTHATFTTFTFMTVETWRLTLLERALATIQSLRSEQMLGHSDSTCRFLWSLNLNMLEFMLWWFYPPIRISYSESDFYVKSEFIIVILCILIWSLFRSSVESAMY